MVVTYKCPSCGGPMVYGAEEGTLVCQYCGATATVAEMEAAERAGKNVREENTAGGQEAREAMKAYRCPNCGAEVVTNEDTVASICGFCGSPNLVEDRLQGEKRPARLIPFKITRQQAEAKFRAWTKNGLLTPSGFTRSNTLEKITGIYVPFWLYDMMAEVDMTAVCTRTRVTRTGDMEYTYTDHYDVRRNIGVHYEKVPADASKEMDDKLMDALEPFSYDDLKRFEMPYLSGYVAERYQYDDAELFDRIKQRVRQYADNACRETIGGYGSVNVVNEQVQMDKAASEYVLLPVWMLSYTYKGEHRMFAINGQTGKTVGKPPISLGKAAAWYGGVAAVCFILLNVIGGLL